MPQTLHPPAPPHHHPPIPSPPPTPTPLTQTKLASDLRLATLKSWFIIELKFKLTQVPQGLQQVRPLKGNGLQAGVGLELKHLRGVSAGRE